MEWRGGNDDVDAMMGRGEEGQDEDRGAATMENGMHMWMSKKMTLFFTHLYAAEVTRQNTKFLFVVPLSGQRPSAHHLSDLSCIDMPCGDVQNMLPVDHSLKTFCIIRIIYLKPKKEPSS